MRFADLAVLEAAQSIPSDEAMKLIGHSVILGFVLMAVTSITMAITSTRFKDPLELRPARGSDIVLSAANVLYLCIGMCGVMLLVSNHVARAFAIGAAIALVRFRIKVDSKTFGMSLFFGVLIGMACGVDHPRVAYGMTAVFSMLQFIVLALAALVDRMSPKVEEPVTVTTSQVVENARPN